MRYYWKNDIEQIYENAQLRIRKLEAQQIQEFAGITLEHGALIKNCDFLVTKDLIESCFGDADLVRRSVLAEASRVDTGLLNFLKDGNDYKTLKRDLRELIDLNNDAEQSPSSIKKGLRACKRIYQAIHDYEIVGGGLAVVGSGAAIGYLGSEIIKAEKLDAKKFRTSPAELAGTISGTKAVMAVSILLIIISFVYFYIRNFVIRYTEDYDDYNGIKDELNENLTQLKKNAKSCKDDKLKKKYEDAIEKIESHMETVEKKRDGVTRKAAGKWIDDRTTKTAIDTQSHQVNRKRTYRED